MTYDEWRAKQDSSIVVYDDERVWQAAQKDAWETVFQIVSDKAHLASREFIRALEAARDEAGVGVE